MEPSLRFRETQAFRRERMGLFFIVPVAILFLAAGGVLYGVVTCPRPGEGVSIAMGLGLPVVLGAGLLFLYLKCELTTEVREKEVFVWLYPFGSGRKIPLSEIKSCAPRTYRPLLEYGGWGIRWGPGGRAYNVSGNQGVQLVLQNGERVLIGSKQSEELARAIEEARGGANLA